MKITSSKRIDESLKFNTWKFFNIQILYIINFKSFLKESSITIQLQCLILMTTKGRRCQENHIYDPGKLIRCFIIDDNNFIIKKFVFNNYVYLCLLQDNEKKISSLETGTMA